LNLPDMNGIEILRQLKLLQPELLVIIITGFASVESAVEAIKLGAYDYIKKPFKADAIKLIVKLALETQALKERVKELLPLQKASGLNTILGDSEGILQVKHRIAEYAKYDSQTVLVTGESGTGKELIARALHNLGSRQNQMFVEINCASIPENLLESELFGYEKGAFTDAQSTKKGLLEKAHKGTLFLDEIGEMSPALQAKLLRVLEHKTFRRLGGTRDITVDLRIIAATNKDLKLAIQEKQFREDLYYR
ncbi:MAG: sigma-54-dependent Fis family transcriptional regulator, partial [Calditrichaeota bacterium]|nr:sigma-54-dependent Fis family transcriptional regulator [Calditrichota bacterium]